MNYCNHQFHPAVSSKEGKKWKTWLFICAFCGQHRTVEKAGSEKEGEVKIIVKGGKRLFHERHG